MPYTVGRVETHDVEDGNPLSNSPDPGASVGLDLKYAVTPGLTLTATANPDFGQVEADPAVVNLDAFETFFPERRPFFVEGSGTFRFNMDCNDGNCTGLFYSRRIGRAPQGSPERPTTSTRSSRTSATIIGAGKLTGPDRQFLARRADRGDRAAKTREIAGATEVDRPALAPVEPLTGYTCAARAPGVREPVVAGLHDHVDQPAERRDDVRSSRTTRSPAASTTTGACRRCTASAATAAGSHLQGSTEAITRLQENNVHGSSGPTADYVELDATATTLSGHAGSVSFGKISGERTRFSSFVGYKSPGFDTNDLGFMRRADERNHDNWFQWRNFMPGKYVRTRNFNINQ